MNALLEQLAVLCTAAGLVAGGLTLASVRNGRVALRVALELWTAASMLRLAGSTSWQALGAAAVVLAVRQLVTRNLASASVGFTRPSRQTPRRNVAQWSPPRLP